MAIIRLQGKKEAELGIYYEFNTSTEPLGEGGMGKVYRGRKIGNDGQTRDVAIKFMFDGLPDSVIDRARREAEIQIPHENLVEMMGFLATETQSTNGERRTHYHVVSELLVGVMLADLLQGVTSTKNGEQVPFAQKLYNLYQQDRERFALVVMRNILSGIMCLHDHDYIHRDIDPTNIMVTKDGKIKLIDFGIAKHLNTLATQDKALTSTGQFMGKAQYAAPELVLGDVPNQNKTTDIYELGILFYQLVQGRLPFEGTSNAILKAQLEKKTPVQQIENPMFASVIAKATQKEPKDRFQSAAEFRVAVEQLEQYVGKKRTIIDKLGKPVVYGTAAVAIFVVLAGGMYALIGTNTDGQKTDTFASVDELTDIKNHLFNGGGDMNEYVERLKQMKDNSDAMYLLSRLYYKPINAGGLSDSIVKMQLNLSGIVEPNNKVAHDYLLNIVKQTPDHYMALYELGLDYLAGIDRTGGEERDLEKSETYFKRALDAALQKGDAVFSEKIKGQLSIF